MYTGWLKPYWIFLNNFDNYIMSDILNKILRQKHEEIAQAKSVLPQDKLLHALQNASPVRNFIAAIKTKHKNNLPAIIAEIKKASPSKGIIRTDFDPAACAKSYEKHNAACLSVLTDELFFQGCAQYLIDARNACQLPVLRKDFIVDEYQIYQSRLWGADAILLIAAALTEDQMLHFEQIAHKLNMTVLVEIHNQQELQKTTKLTTELLGINNRDLKTFTVSLETTFSLLKFIDSQKKIVVTESGIKTHDDIQQMQIKGVNTFLIGETFMREPNPGYALHTLLKQ